MWPGLERTSVGEGVRVTTKGLAGVEDPRGQPCICGLSYHTSHGLDKRKLVLTAGSQQGHGCFEVKMSGRKRAGLRGCVAFVLHPVINQESCHLARFRVQWFGYSFERETIRSAIHHTGQGSI